MPLEVPLKTPPEPPLLTAIRRAEKIPSEELEPYLIYPIIGSPAVRTCHPH